MSLGSSVDVWEGQNWSAYLIIMMHWTTISDFGKWAGSKFENVNHSDSVQPQTSMAPYCLTVPLIPVCSAAVACFSISLVQTRFKQAIFSSNRCNEIHIDSEVNAMPINEQIRYFLLCFISFEID